MSVCVLFGLHNVYKHLTKRAETWKCQYFIAFKTTKMAILYDST